MPKDSRERSLSLDRASLSPFPCRSTSRQPQPKNPLEDDKNAKQWEDARCPVCMEHPHNAILLMCSSHEKGCRPFMCDTSYRHSNCFDQFRKSFKATSAEIWTPEDLSNLTTMPLLSTTVASENPVPNPETEPGQDGSASSIPAAPPQKPKLVCPLCRGNVNGWTVVESARGFMNAKPRTCASETCDFNGTYTELRKHARSIHPLVRPTDTDPERQRNWRRLERQRDLGDLLSTLQSSIGEERTDGSTLTLEEGGWLTVFLLVRFIQPGNSSSSRSRSTRARAQVALRRYPRRLWGETYDNVEQRYSRDDEGSESLDNGVRVHRRNVRRRLNNTENQNQNQNQNQNDNQER
ncbi:uncharacterized protein LOC127264046 [Andrographis paniculata]|uniref:uncharacterized protein LOC127264046 n=1 Tax=Andrographis paniculata TaxID=175694 RepID=UPI0021E91EE5|nr:uncharacterized protein LOC127264046 [Andrographis paniculata]XP_051149346.1 uncharacterized protein LOC127264046 [Andrographis paniculata]XP_051149347.1 uncharacterized protein LOC127264046 [Andrographis paniculata]